MRNDKKEPDQFMCIDGDMHKVIRGQFITVQAYNNLLQRYRKLLKLARIKGLLKKKRD